MHPDVDELRPKLKELLYDCAIEIKATKAALYLFDGTNRFELVTEYGFRGVIRQSADMNDVVVDRCGRGRNAFFINGVATEPRFSQVMFDASTDRMLVAPLYLRGKLVGIIDMRDKAGKLPFEQSDITSALKIAERMVGLFAGRNLFGQQFISLSEAPDETPAAPPAASAAAVAEVAVPTPAPAAAPAAPAPRAAEPRAARAEAEPRVPRLATLVIEARNAAARIMASNSAETLSEADFTAGKEILRSILLIPGAVAASLSAYGHLGGVQEVASRGPLTEEGKSVLQSKLNVWLSKRGETPGYLRSSVSTPLGSGGAAVTPADLQKIFTAPITVGSLRGLYLTVAFAGNPDRQSHELLGALHAYLQLAIEHSMQRGTTTTLQSRVAAALLEPDFARYPELRRHSELVAKLSEDFARYLMLTPQEIETARIVGLVHDVGMRLLDYERLYRKRDLSAEEMGFLREHPSVGAAVVEPILGGEIARAVLAHHERVDGRGYPNELRGDEIPYTARLVQICDAFLAMTDADTYQAPEPVDLALATIANTGGSQFDKELAGRFVEMMRRNG